MAKRSRNLLSYFGEENDLDTGTEEPEQSISRPKRSKHRESGYNSSWRKTFPWLEYKVDHGLYCTLCKTHNLETRYLKYTKEEEQFLMKGVERFGHRWKYILSQYRFQEGRTASSLRDKFRKKK